MRFMTWMLFMFLALLGIAGAVALVGVGVYVDYVLKIPKPPAGMSDSFWFYGGAILVTIFATIVCGDLYSRLWYDYQWQKRQAEYIDDSVDELDDQ